MGGQPCVCVVYVIRKLSGQSDTLTQFGRLEHRQFSLQLTHFSSCSPCLCVPWLPIGVWTLVVVHPSWTHISSSGWPTLNEFLRIPCGPGWNPPSQHFQCVDGCHQKFCSLTPPGHSCHQFGFLKSSVCACLVGCGLAAHHDKATQVLTWLR